MLGEFEYLLLTAAKRLGEEAYGASIRQEIEGATGRRCSIGALYTTLDRLEAKGFLKTWMGEATPQRGGRSKRMVRVTAKGIQAATAFYAAVTRVSRGVSWEANRVAGGWRTSAARYAGLSREAAGGFVERLAALARSARPRGTGGRAPE